MFWVSGYVFGLFPVWFFCLLERVFYVLGRVRRCFISRIYQAGNLFFTLTCWGRRIWTAAGVFSVVLVAGEWGLAGFVLVSVWGFVAQVQIWSTGGLFSVVFAAVAQVLAVVGFVMGKVLCLVVRVFSSYTDKDLMLGGEVLISSTVVWIIFLISGLSVDLVFSGGEGLVCLIDLEVSN